MPSRKQGLKNVIRDIKLWYVFVLLIISVVVCVFALRANNQHMNVLRSDVYTTDKNGGNVPLALQNLETYVTSNMNTSLNSGPNSAYPPIQLTYSYNRQTANQSATEQQQNSNIYTEAEDYCQAVIPEGFSGRYRVPCIEQYISSHSLDTSSVDSSLYEFDFISPTWSPDLAGWSMLASIFLAVVFITIFALRWHWNRLDKKSFNN